MDMRNGWEVKFVQEDALLFKAAPDGTVTMRAVPRKHWEALLAEHATRGYPRSVQDVARKIVNLEAKTGADFNRGVR